MFRSVGVWEVVIVLAIILVVFGAAKLPQMAHSLGRSLTSFRKGLRETADDVKDAIKEDVAATDAADEVEPSSTNDSDKPRKDKKSE